MRCSVDFSRVGICSFKTTTMHKLTINLYNIMDKEQAGVLIFLLVILKVLGPTASACSRSAHGLRSCSHLGAATRLQHDAVLLLDDMRNLPHRRQGLRNLLSSMCR
ncbi:hypothetical protein Bbelb_278510 [Branchiostoma belcheri]|nr:hypothetical protein Bbelb_278510 [Branchiostoma belcheri]